jgi:putative colanic acid biosynthesis glycosyltransferase WcaI
MEFESNSPLSALHSPPRPMKILVHDYVGHPFQVQLSRELAGRGHDVLHLYCSSFVTPRGELERRDDDPPGFRVRGIALSSVIPKMNFFRRFKLEAEYAGALTKECEQFQPEVVLSANTPSIVQNRLAGWCQRHGVRLVSWIQDIYGLAAYRLLGRKLPVIGHLAGKYFISLDKASARRSDAIVVITSDFTKALTGWGVDPSRIHVIHNWAPLEDMPVRPRDNAWSRAQMLDHGLRFLYSGTLAMKHNPALLLELARMLDRDSSGELIVVSEGAGVEWLAEQAANNEIGSLRCMGFQPFEALADVQGSADVLVAILEADAGVFSVPSKVLSYMCARRPLLLAVPSENLAAKIVAECGAGLAVEPTDMIGFRGAAQRLIDSAQDRQKYGEAARRYAETNFDIRHIGDQFEAILRGKN